MDAEGWGTRKASTAIFSARERKNTKKNLDSCIRLKKKEKKKNLWVYDKEERRCRQQKKPMK
jgi:hypothetical protein